MTYLANGEMMLQNGGVFCNIGNFIIEFSATETYEITQFKNGASLPDHTAYYTVPGRTTHRYTHRDRG